MLHHGHTSQQLPNYNSVTFKCQQKTTGRPNKGNYKQTNLSLPNAFQKSGFSILPKKIKLSDKCDNFEPKSKKSKVTDNSEEILEETLFVETESEILTFQHDLFDEKNGFESEIMNKNPWLVESIQDFYFLKCPECDYDTKEEYSFQDHAVENHPLSFAFFMKSEPANIENVLDVSILPQEQVHERKKRKPCPHCDHTSANNSNLRKHIAAFHDGENINLSKKCPKNPLIMKSEPVNIENDQDASILSEDIDIFENSLEIKSEYHEDNYSEPIENETVSKKEENDIMKKDLVNVTAENVQKISKLNPKSGILKTKRVFKTKPGPKSTGRPSKEKYKCPVKDCNSQVRGTDIGKHFKTKANLLVLDTATEYQSTLGKSSTSATEQFATEQSATEQSATEQSATEQSAEEHLKSLLSDSSESEKWHTIHMFNHGHTSHQLPNYNSIGFKCQQKSVKLNPGWIKLKDRPKKKKSYNCRICSTLFDSKADREIHLTTVHDGKSNRTPHLCSECGKRFNSKLELKSHTILVHEKKKPLECKYCGRGFVIKNMLRIHEETVHEGKKPHICEICGVAFPFKASLRIHIDGVHEKKKDFKCSLCSYCCVIKGQLAYHIARVHEKKKPFQCEICSSWFATPEHVRRHTKEVHEKNKDHDCHLCNVSFARKSNLTAHILSVHENVKRTKNRDS